MEYTIKAHETVYSGVLFRSRLEARWAAFLDLVGWKWEYEPLDLHGWTPDFRVIYPCGRRGCADNHVLLVEVKPYYDIDQFINHPCMNYPNGMCFGDDGTFAGQYIPAHASAAFGNNPGVTHWEMAHNGGFGSWYQVSKLIRGWEQLWKEAGNVVRYLPKQV